MRESLVAGIELVDAAIMKLQGGPATGPAAILSFLTAVAGILLLAGLWRPIMGVLVATIELWNAYSQPGDPWTHILLGTLGVAMALLGAGAWSVDARLLDGNGSPLENAGLVRTPLMGSSLTL